MRARLGCAGRRATLTRGVSRAGAGAPRESGVDRSSINARCWPRAKTRMPGGHVVAACARGARCLGDWLLGLTRVPARARGSPLLASILLDFRTGRGRASGRQPSFCWHLWLWPRRGRRLQGAPTAPPGDSMPAGLTLHLNRPTRCCLGITRRRQYHHRRRPHGCPRRVSPCRGRAALTGSPDRKRLPHGEWPFHEMESFARGEGYYAGARGRGRRASNWTGWPSLTQF